MNIAQRTYNEMMASAAKRLAALATTEADRETIVALYKANPRITIEELEEIMLLGDK